MDYDESTTPQNKVLFISPTVLFSHGKDDSNAAAEVAVITVTVSKKKGKKETFRAHLSPVSYGPSHRTEDIK